MSGFDVERMCKFFAMFYEQFSNTTIDSFLLLY